MAKGKGFDPKKEENLKDGARPFLAVGYNQKHQTIDLMFQKPIKSIGMDADGCMTLLSSLAKRLGEMIGMPILVEVGGVPVDENVEKIQMQYPTTMRLAIALVKAGCPTEMVNNALNGRYDDFKSDYPTPQIDLVRDLRELKAPEELIRDVMDGEFDATKAESDAWAAGDGKEIIESFFNQTAATDKPQGSDDTAAASL